MSKIVTHYGNVIDLLDPDPADISLFDIAHNLSHLCRFNGATKYRYSVAQHSLFVSRLVSPQHALQALMHDATEAYLGDVVKPLKELLPDYQTLEDRMWASICEALGIEPYLTEEVHRGDVSAYLKERVTLIGKPILEDPDYHRYVGQLIIDEEIPGDQDPNEVKQEFMTRFHTLKRRTVL